MGLGCSRESRSGVPLSPSETSQSEGHTGGKASTMERDSPAAQPVTEIAKHEAGGLGVLKGRGHLGANWANHPRGGGFFDYNPFDGDGMWSMEMDGDEDPLPGDLLLGMHARSGRDGAASAASGAITSSGIPSTSTSGSNGPTMCAKMAAQSLGPARVQVEETPPDCPPDLADFLHAHTCRLRLNCKKHRRENDASDYAHLTWRPLSPHDKEAIQGSLEHDLSLRSQVMRFLTPTPKLSDRELEYLTKLDYKRHFAWGVACETHGIAVGRYVCESPESSRAEVALTVIDPMQGLGLSALLLWALSHTAFKNGVERFTAVYHKQNGPVARMTENLTAQGGDVKELGDGNFSLEIPLPIPLPQIATVLLSEADLFAFMVAVDGRAAGKAVAVAESPHH